MYRKIFTLSRLILVITVAAILIILAGCSSTSSPTTPAATTTTTSAATTTASTSRAPSTSASSTSAAGGGPVSINLVAQNISFDLKTITVKAGSQVTINFNNKDSGIPHNFAAYTDQGATKSIYVGQVITGPATATYTFTAPTTPGNYFFRCDIHPTQMTGQFIVQ